MHSRSGSARVASAKCDLMLGSAVAMTLQRRTSLYMKPEQCIASGLALSLLEALEPSKVVGSEVSGLPESDDHQAAGVRTKSIRNVPFT